MTGLTRSLDTFPSVHLPSQSAGLPVEVVLIAQIGIGAGSPLIASTAALQRGHCTHRRYVAPAMLSMAVGHVLATPMPLRATPGAFAWGDAR